jgi:hypothetical protein
VCRDGPARATATLDSRVASPAHARGEGGRVAYLIDLAMLVVLAVACRSLKHSRLPRRLPRPICGAGRAGGWRVVAWLRSTRGGAPLSYPSSNPSLLSVPAARPCARQRAHKPSATGFFLVNLLEHLEHLERTLVGDTFTLTVHELRLTRERPFPRKTHPERSRWVHRTQRGPPRDVEDEEAILFAGNGA